MSTESSIQTNSLPWQVRQAGKNLSEWIQLQLSGESPQETPPSTFEFPAWIGPFLFWSAVVGGVIWAAFLLVQLIDLYRSHHQNRKPRPEIRPVPEPVKSSVAEWLKRARQFERERNWPEACRALYMAALQLLDDREWISHLASRTDGEYLEAVSALKQPRPLQLLIRTHERSLFAGEAVTAENLKRCRSAYEEIEQR